MLNNNSRDKGGIKTNNHIPEHTAMGCRITSNDTLNGTIKKCKDHDLDNFYPLMIFSVSRGATTTQDYLLL